MINATLVFPEGTISQLKVNFALELTLAECETIEKEIEKIEGRSEAIESIRTALYELRASAVGMIAELKFK